MIYEINEKLYFKVENYFAEINVIDDRIVPTKEFRKIYCEDVDNSKIKIYNSIKEYNNSKLQGKKSKIFND